jgi:Ca-activated chloride channel family protein
LIQPPTTDSEALQSAVESLATGRRTAIGSGILKALDAIAEIDPSVAPSTTSTSREPQPTPVPRGAYAPDIIVVLTDGVSNAGPPPTDAAQQAADRGVRVYDRIWHRRWRILSAMRSAVHGPRAADNRALVGGQFGADSLAVGISPGIGEDAEAIADMTGGTYYSAESAGG